MTVNLVTINEPGPWYDFKPDESLSFPDFLRLMFTVYKTGPNSTACFFKLTADAKMLAVIPEEFHKYFVVQP